MQVEFWDKTLFFLKNEVTVIGYNTWMANIQPVSYDEDSVFLRVPAEFNKGILESRYSGLITNAIEQVTNKKYKLVFLLPGEAAPDEIQIKKTNGFGKFAEDESFLNPKYTFETFIIGNSNRLAHAGSVAVAEAPAKAYNPLFLYGGVGLGKTHLMQAIGHYVINHNPGYKVLYVTSEKFTNELIQAIRDDKNEQFRTKYRNIDVLLIDDIQFIGGKERTQEEFFHTFNSLYEANKQIIVSSDKSPNDIITLEERLRSRFEWGLIADIQSPDLETRIAILNKKAQIDRVEVPYEILAFIAEKIPSNIRQLEGALNRVLAYNSLTYAPVTMDVAKEALKEILAQDTAREINEKVIKDVVSRYFDLKVSDLSSKRRSRDVSFPRQIAMYLCRSLTDMSLPKIGEKFGGRDHTTVMHAFNKISVDINENEEIRNTIEEIKKNFYG
jgi:chromosomal replication initiator protein